MSHKSLLSLLQKIFKEMYTSFL